VYHIALRTVACCSLNGKGNRSVTIKERGEINDSKRHLCPRLKADQFNVGLRLQCSGDLRMSLFKIRTL